MIRRLPAVFFWLIWVLACAARSFAGEANSAVADALSRKLLSPAIPLQEIKDFVDAHLLPMPEPKTVADWERYANRVRKEALDRVIFRGEAAKWRTLPTAVEWQKPSPAAPVTRSRSYATKLSRASGFPHSFTSRPSSSLSKSPCRSRSMVIICREKPPTTSKSAASTRPSAA